MLGAARGEPPFRDQRYMGTDALSRATRTTPISEPRRICRNPCDIRAGGDTDGLTADRSSSSGATARCSSLRHCVAPSPEGAARRWPVRRLQVRVRLAPSGTEIVFSWIGHRRGRGARFRVIARPDRQASFQALLRALGYAHAPCSQELISQWRMLNCGWYDARLPRWGALGSTSPGCLWLSRPTARRHDAVLPRRSCAAISCARRRHSS
jgi:hypothetical protein